MKIQYITNARMPTEKAHGIQIAKACEAFANAGHEVELIVPARRNPITESVFAYYGLKQNFTIRKIFTVDSVRWGTLGFLIETFSFALSAVRCVDSQALIYGRDERVLAVLIFFGAKRVVWESHDGAWNRLAAYVARKARAVVVVTGSAKTIYTERGVPEEKILAVSNGIDTAAFSHPESTSAARERLGLPADGILALYVGRLDGWKGTDTLLEASKLLSGGIRVAIIGGEPQQIESLRVRYPGVIFLGYRPYRELADNQAAADVLVVPNTGKDMTSVSFTSPLKLLAHLAAHRPIIASDLPSIREIAGDAVLYVPPDDPTALATGIKQVLQDTALSERLVKAAETAVSEYDWNRRAGRILSFISP